MDNYWASFSIYAAGVLLLWTPVIIDTFKKSK